MEAGRFGKPIKQDPEEFEALVAEIDKVNPKVIVEIGVLRGGIISHFRDKVDQVIGIDKGNHPMGLQEDMPDDVIIGDSHSFLTKRELEKRLDGKKIDVLFIDGDHSYKGCKQDYCMYSPFVRDGGIVAFHDILLGGWHKEAKIKHGVEIEVGKVWNELKSKFKFKEIVSGDTWAGIGVLYV